jgi:hypothetical protein
MSYQPATYRAKRLEKRAAEPDYWLDKQGREPEYLLEYSGARFSHVLASLDLLQSQAAGDFERRNRFLKVCLQYSKTYGAEARWTGNVAPYMDEIDCYRSQSHFESALGDLNLDLLRKAVELMRDSELIDWREFGQSLSIERAVILLALGDTASAVKVFEHKRNYKSLLVKEAEAVKAMCVAAHEAQGRVKDSRAVDQWLWYFDTQRAFGIDTWHPLWSRLRGTAYCRRMEAALVTHRYLHSDGELNYEAALELIVQ